jgi:hypothetical protein
MIFDSSLLLLAGPLIAIGFGLTAWLSRRRRLAATTAWSRGLGRAARATGRGGPWLLGACLVDARRIHQLIEQIGRRTPQERLLVTHGN